MTLQEYEIDLTLKFKKTTKLMSNTKENLTVREIAQQVAQEVGQMMAKQVAQQVAQEVAQNQAKQIAQATEQAIQAAKQSVQGTNQETASAKENKFEEINSGEALRLATVSNTRLWNANDKAIFEKSHDYDAALKSLDLASARLAHSTKQFLDQVAVSEAQNIGAFNNALRMDYAKFNNATSEPIAPNTQTPGDGEDND